MPPKTPKKGATAADKAEAAKRRKEQAAAEKARKQEERLERERMAQNALPTEEDVAADATLSALVADIKYPVFSKLPKTVFDIDTYTFPYKSERPDKNPELTVWALLNAFKGCTVKGLEAADRDKEVRLLEVRTKKSKATTANEPYSLNFSSGQNCDAMLRHLFGTERDDMEVCEKCRKENGALKGCITTREPNSACANCDWNRSGAPCSFTKKRKASTLTSDDEEDIPDPFEAFDRKTLLALIGVFKAAIDRKKHKKN